MFGSQTVKEDGRTIERGPAVSIDDKDYCVDVHDGKHESVFRVHCLTDNKSSKWVSYSRIARYNHVAAVSLFWAANRDDELTPLTAQRLCEIVGIM